MEGSVNFATSPPDHSIVDSRTIENSKRTFSSRWSLRGYRSAMPGRKLLLGLCCMDSKANGNPMKALLRRLEASGIFDIVIFGEVAILTQDIEDWPRVECLIAFHSNGFPLEKAIAYVKMVKPIEINCLEKQRLLRDRLAVYETLRLYEIPCPSYMYIDYTNLRVPYEETDDYILYNGRKISKPFVEKPIDADDHNIWIYYPPSVGGGCKKLIRKTDDKSSEFDPNCNKVRRDGAYVYEPFLPTQGMDVKVYMVGGSYSHAEARKAPTVDGRVMRSKDGKEIRYPIALSEFEKACGALIVNAFSQYFCGFDVLRTKGGSVICDVNGWSFVKGNQRYYDDAALLLQRYFLDKINVKFPIEPFSTAAEHAEPDSNELYRTHNEHGLEEENQLAQSSLRSVLVIMRHGDRRPKEKLKFKTTNSVLLGYFTNRSPTNEVLVKHPEDMERLLASVRGILLNMNEAQELRESEEYRKFDTLRMVLELHESFEGLTRKVQLKPIEFVTSTSGMTPTRVLVVAKWGGELTDMGRAQAEELGRTLRQTLFPVSTADSADDSLLRLHSSFRHDFKIYSSIEGRCQTTAAAFTKGFLDLEGDLTPILVSLVCYDEFAKGLLDEPIPKNDRDSVKADIDEILHRDSMDGLMAAMVPSEPSGAAYEAVQMLLKEGSPIECLRRIYTACCKFLNQLNCEINQLVIDNPNVVLAQVTVSNPSSAQNSFRMRPASGSGSSLSPSVAEMPLTGPGPRLQQRVEDLTTLRWVQLRRIEHRWSKIVYSFSKSSNRFDTSKVTDLWDCAYYDIIHHYSELPQCALDTLQNDLMSVLVPMHAWVSVSEFGITDMDKLRIGVETTWRLLQKVVNDVEFMLQELTESGQRTVPISESSQGCVGNIPGSPRTLSCDEIPQLLSRGSLKSAKVVSTSGSPHCGTVYIGDDAQVQNGVGTPLASGYYGGRGSKSSKVPPELRALLRQAMRDGSDWHPRLHDTVAQVTGMKTSKCIRTRVYVTSASTMHSLLNVFAFGKEVSDEDPIDKKKLSSITDLHYLSHIVIRCFEEPELLSSSAAPASPPSTSNQGIRRHLCKSFSNNNGAESGGSVSPQTGGYRYSVEVMFSPGVQVKGHSGISVSPELLREHELCVAPLQSLCRENICSLDEFDAFLTEILAEFGKLSDDHQSNPITIISSPRAS